MLVFMLCYVDFYSKEAQTSCQNMITKENPQFVKASILQSQIYLGKTILTKIGF